METNPHDSISSLPDSLSYDVGVYIFYVAILGAELVLLFFALFIVFVLLHLVCQSMSLGHLSGLVLHLLHLDVLQHILLPLAKFVFFSWNLAASLASL